jgi:hypothetical protein
VWNPIQPLFYLENEMKKLFSVAFLVLFFPAILFAGDWENFGIGALLTYDLTLSADATATVLPGADDYAGTYLLPVYYLSSADDAVVFTLHRSATDSYDLLNGGGTVADATTGGHVSPNDRWWIDGPLYYTLTGLGSGTITLKFAVSKDR